MSPAPTEMIPSDMIQLLWTAKDRGVFMASLLQFETSLKDKKIIAEMQNSDFEWINNFIGVTATQIIFTE